MPRNMKRCVQTISNIVFDGPDGNAVLDSKCNVSGRAEEMSAHLCIDDHANEIFDVGRTISESLGLVVSADGNIHIPFDDWFKNPEIMDVFGATLVSVANTHGNGPSHFATLITMNRPWLVVVVAIAFMMGVQLPSDGAKGKMFEHVSLTPPARVPRSLACA